MLEYYGRQVWFILFCDSYMTVKLVTEAALTWNLNVALCLAFIQELNEQSKKKVVDLSLFIVYNDC